jgi:pectin methylesterase-like acyl-CoA thioesterase
MKLMSIPIRFLLPIRPDLGRTSVRAGLLACLPVFALVAAGSVHAATLTVCPSRCDFTAIQPAVDSASSGDTVRIFSGMFPGFSITDKSLVLRGEGASRTVIDLSLPAVPPAEALTLSCSQSFRITIQDLAITNPHTTFPGQNGLINSGCKLKLKNSTVTIPGGLVPLPRNSYTPQAVKGLPA